LSPKSVVYKSSSIIYFKGDVSEKIYLLDEGQVGLNSINIETGQEVHELIKTGEFFGVRSALGHYPREETAIVHTDSKVVVFTIPEFELVVSKNTRIIIKMLKVFSTQLRRIQNQLKNLIATGEHINPEAGLYKIAQYYLGVKKYTQAIYVFKRYLVYYPSGKFADQAAANLRIAEDYAQKYGQGKGPETQTGATPRDVQKPSKAKELSSNEKSYYSGVTMMGEQKYADALKLFQEIISQNGEDEYSLKARFESGKCLFYLNQPDQCIRTFSAIMQKYPKHPDLNEALFFIGQCNEKKGEVKKALDIYRKILSITPESKQLYNQVEKAIRKIERT
jgi:CRP-like cAMP-binding protein